MYFPSRKDPKAFKLSYDDSIGKQGADYTSKKNSYIVKQSKMLNKTQIRLILAAHPKNMTMYFTKPSSQLDGGNKKGQMSDLKLGCRSTEVNSLNTSLQIKHGRNTEQTVNTNA